MGVASVIGAIVGLFIGGGPIGGLIGYCLGKMLEGSDNLKLENIFSTTDNKERFSFQISLLTLMAAVMQANGLAKRSELDFVKTYIKKAFPTDEDQKNALKLLKNLLEENIDVDGVAKQVGRQMNIYHKRELIHFLLGIGYADGILQRSEDSIILKIALKMGVSSVDYNAIKAAYFTNENGEETFYRGGSSQNSSSSSSNNTKREQSSSSSSGGSSYSRSSGSSARQSSGMSLSTAYSVLGIQSTATNEEVVKAYRSMCKKFHPDRVQSLGENAVKDAEEHMTKINQAYSVVKSNRNM